MALIVGRCKERFCDSWPKEEMVMGSLLLGVQKRRQTDRSGGGKGGWVLGSLGWQTQACSANLSERFVLAEPLSPQFLLPGEKNPLEHLFLMEHPRRISGP